MTRPQLTVLSFVLGLIALPVAAYAYFSLGKPPVAVADKPFPLEDRIVRVPLGARIHREMPQSAPIQPTDENLNAGAETYQDKCEVCHGVAGEPSEIGGKMFPRAPELFAKHGNGVVGVSDDPVGETYWKVKNGIRLTGMPSFEETMTDTQMWQVSLLLSRADKPLPAEAAKTVGQGH
jgi:mono/diheme cytochrome c family protein